jgi:GTP-binding protein YchF
MQLGILGFPKVGKTTLFNILTGTEQATDKFAASDKVNMGVASVPDPRLVQLRELFNPKKFSPATLDYVDIPGIKKGEGSESLDLAKLKTVDALLHVVRAFDDPELIHSEGDLDPARDIATIDLELILADHGLVERRLEKLEQSKKRGLKPEEKREEALLKDVILPALENETPLRQIELAAEDELRLRGFQLLSAKPMLAVINVDEDRLGDSETLLAGLDLPEGVQAVIFSAPIEAEISKLDEEEQKEFLADYGLTEPSLDRALRASLELLGLISFFTVGEDEVKAWTVRRDTPARRAAGAIHSDIERGFIRAEVTRWEDLVRLKSLAACRDQALLRLEGKEYPVKDGEVIHFRFNV